MKRDRAELENFDFNKEDIPLEKKRKIQKNKDYLVELHVGENEIVKTLGIAFQSMGQFNYFGRDVTWKIILHDNNHVVTNDFLVDNAHNVNLCGAQGSQSRPKISFLSNFIIKNSSVKFENIDFHIKKNFCLSDTPLCEFVRCQINGNLIIRKQSVVDFQYVEITNSTTSGLIIQDQSKVKLRTCSIRDCVLSNIVQMDQSHMQISNSRVFRSQKTGIWVQGSGSTKIVHCDIYQNKCSNICLSHDSKNITIQKCKINDSSQNGIVIRGLDCGNIRIERNVIKNNKYPNIYLKMEDNTQNKKLYNTKEQKQQQQQPYRNGRYNQQFGGREEQIMFEEEEEEEEGGMERREIVLSDNEISFGNSGGILVKGGSNTSGSNKIVFPSIVIVSNKIISNKYHPLVVSGKLRPMVSGNDIRNNQKSNVVQYRD